VSLHSPSCVINQFRGGMAALFCNSPCCIAAILKRIRDGTRRPRSLVRCLVNLYAHLFQH
jgi:hypothetical protein